LFFQLKQCFSITTNQPEQCFGLFFQRSERGLMLVLSNSFDTCLYVFPPNYQLPFLQGLSILEKLAAPLAPLIVGRTGAQLFLTDGDPSKPPLLLQMASDCDDKKYM